MKRRDHKNEVTLREEERQSLRQLISSGKAPARKLAHARILLKIDRNSSGPEWTDEQVAEAFEVSRSTVLRIRERFVEHGLDDALSHRHAPQARSRALDGEQEAHLIALSCSAVRRGTRAGRCVCSLIVWCNWTMWSRSVMKRYDAH